MLWKNSMRAKAIEKYPELDVDEVRKLVDRDWRVMSEENRRVCSWLFRIFVGYMRGCKMRGNCKVEWKL
jgi:hypothetical protein